MSEYFQVDVVARSFRELVLRVEVIDGNPNGFHIERNCALLMALDAEPRDNALTRDLADQLGCEFNLSSYLGDVDAMEKALGTIAVQYIEQVEILATENLNPTAVKTPAGTIGWRQGDGIGSVATYRILFTEARWMEHINAGADWTSMAWDMTYGEERDRSFEVEVIEREGSRIVLHVKAIDEYADPASDSARFALGLLVERASVTPQRFGDSLPALEVQVDDVMNAAAPNYIQSVARRTTEDGDAVTLEVAVTDPACIVAFEPGMRWVALGFA
jgi:hypothetical protein